MKTYLNEGSPPIPEIIVYSTESFALVRDNGRCFSSEPYFEHMVKMGREALWSIDHDFDDDGDSTHL